MDGYGRRDVNGKANAGLTLGIIGTALGAWALFGNRRSAGVLGTGAGLMGDGSTNINVVGAGMGSAGAPTAFQAWSKSCEDTLALQGGLYQWALTQQSQRFQDRQVIDSEMFGLYKSQIDAEIEPLTNEQRNMLATNEEYVANYNNLQSMVQAEVLNLVRANIENSPEGKALLDNQLKLVKNLKTSIIEMSQREMQLFNAFKEASAKNPSLTYEEFIKTMK